MSRCISPAGVTAVLPSWSRDGQWIYFASDRTGDWQVWKVPSGGGPAVQVTRHGGWEAFESTDGQWLYYAKDHRYRGIWRVPVTGGEENEVLNQGRGQSWAIAASGIYLKLEEDAIGATAIDFYSFTSQHLDRLYTIPKELGVVWGTGSLAVSPDGRSILVVAHERVRSDLMLVENFK